MAIPSGYRFHHTGNFYKNEAGEGPFMVDPQGRASQALPYALYTDKNGPYARIRVDVGQTGFFAGREFRTIQMFTIPQGSTNTVKIVCPVDFYVQSAQILLAVGKLTWEWFEGGTDATAFTVPLAVRRTNMTANADHSYSPQLTVTNGGTFTGGVLFDSMMIDTGGNMNAAPVGTVQDDVLGLAAGTYYMRITNTHNQEINGSVKFRWEERPPTV